jgi:predicted transcriptional regulator
MAGTGKVQSIERAIRVLDCFTERNEELKLTEISEMLDLNKSTLLLALIIALLIITFIPQSVMWIV